MTYTKDNANQKSPKRGGWYHFTVDGRSVKYPSITNILGMIDKSRFLVPWAGKACARLACDEPWLTPEEVYSKHRQQDVVAAGQRGKGVHNVAPKIFNHEEVPDIHRNYVEPLKEFFKEHNPTVIDCEKVVRSDKYGIGGSLDFILSVGKETHLVDIKTSKAVYSTFGLQLGFYKQALSEEGITVDKVYVLHLPGNNKYNLVNTVGNMEIVQNLKQIYMWNEEQ